MYSDPDGFNFMDQDTFESIATECWRIKRLSQEGIK